MRAENAALRAENERLRGQVEELRRASKRQAAPFSMGDPKKDPKRSGRKPGEDYGTRAHRQVPGHVDEDGVTVYLIADGRGYDQACIVLGAGFDGVLERDGWAPYRRFAPHTRRAWRTCWCAAAS